MLLGFYEVHCSLGDPWFFDDRGDSPKGGPCSGLDVVRKERRGGSVSGGVLLVYYMCEGFCMGVS